MSNPNALRACMLDCDIDISNIDFADESQVHEAFDTKIKKILHDSDNEEPKEISMGYFF